MMHFHSKSLTVLVIMVVVAGLVEQGKAQTCASTFFSSLVQLIPCRAAVVPFNPLPPSAACCNAIKTLGQPCLCVLVNGPPITGVDRNMAMQLPDKCTVNFESCNSLSFLTRLIILRIICASLHWSCLIFSLVQVVSGSKTTSQSQRKCLSIKSVLIAIGRAGP